MTPRKMLSPTRFSFGAIATTATFFAATALAISLIVAAANDSYAQQASAPGAVSSVTVTRADGTITASWDAVSGATKYHAMYSDDDRGSWHGPVDDHTNIQTTSITFSADNAKSIIVGVRAGNDHGWSAWTDSPTVGPYTPGAVSSVTVTRADGTVTASWDAVPGATKYHSMYSDDDRGSWHGPVDDHTNIQTTSITFSADNAKSIIVGVRAWNDNGWSEWTDSPTVGPYTPPPPGAVSSVSVTRADGTVTASWQAVPGATKYHSMYSDDDRGSWHGPVDDHTNIQTTSITFTADNAKSIIVGVRAGNDHGWSEWRDSPKVGPYTPPTPTPTPTPRGIIVQDTSGNPLSAISVPEGGEASYQVLLTAPPTEDVEVCVALFVRDNDDSDITFKGQAADVVSIKLTFTSENWNTAQTVTLVAAEDDTDDVNGARDVTHDAREYYSGKVDITATEIDNDEITLPDAPAGLTATASDGSVTLSWDDPSDSSITGYEYNVNHNDTSSGNLSGWGPWTAIAGSDSATTSHTFTGLTNGREYRYHLRAVNSAGNSTAAPNEAPWFASAIPAIPVPDAPANLSVTPGDGYLDLSWDAVSDATGYDIRAKTSNSNSWHSVATDVTATSYRYTTSETIDYVAVRATNASGGNSEWTEASRLPDHGWLNTVQSSQSSGGASIASANAQNQLAAPSWGTITRGDDTARRSGRIDVNWTGVSNATGYNLVCAVAWSESPGWNWHPCGWVDAATDTVKFTTIPANASQPVGIVSYKRGSESQLPPGIIPLEGSQLAHTTPRSYAVAIRAVSTTPGNASAWVPSASINPLNPLLSNVTDTRTDGQITLSWTPNPWTTGYEIDCAVLGSSYTRCATLSNQDHSATEHSVTISTWTAGGTNYAIGNSSIYDIRICSTNTWGSGCYLAPLIYPNPSLTASSVGVTTATLTIAHHTGNWYYKHTNTGATCDGPVSGTSKDLTGLTANTSYTYSAYSDSGCTSAKLLAAAAEFTTAAYGDRDTSREFDLHSANGTPDGIWSDGTTMWVVDWTVDKLYAYTLASGARDTSKEFNLNSANDDPNGIWSDGTTMWVADNTDAKLYAYTLASGARDTSKEFNLNSANDDPYGIWSDGTTMWVANVTDAKLYAYTLASGARDTSKEFNLNSANDDPTGIWSDGTTMWVADNTDVKLYAYTLASGARDTSKEFNLNSANDDPTGIWSDGTTTWVVDWADAKLYTYYSFPPAKRLTASSVRATTATLNITWHTSAWYYKASSGPHTTCQGPVNASLVALTGLSAATSYTYSAYSDSGCTSGKLLATAAEFTTLSIVSVSTLGGADNGVVNVGGGSPTQRVAQAFTTGSNTGGYTLSSIAIAFRATVGSPTDLEVTLHAASGLNPNTGTTLATLSGSNPSTAGSYTYTCSSGCDMSASTTYFVYIKAPNSVSGSHYLATFTSSDETLTPSGNGWSMADKGRLQYVGVGWFDSGSHYRIAVTATTK